MGGPRSSQESSEEHLLMGEDKHELYGAVETTKMRKGSYPGMARTPLPWNQLRLVIFMRLAEPIAYTQIFPVSLKCCLYVRG
jgi:hypothetical protein